MGAILRPFARQLNPSSFQTPTGSLAIDWTHPLTNGLIGCWIPGVTRAVNLARSYPAMSFYPSQTFGVNASGPGTINTGQGTGFYADIGTSTEFTNWTEMSVFWYGYSYGNGGYGYTPIIGAKITNVYDAYWFGLGAPYSNYLRAVYADNTMNFRAFSDATPFSAMNSAGMTLKFNGSIYAYLNGKASGNWAWSGVVAPAEKFTSTSQLMVDSYPPYNHASVWTNTLTNIACFWNRQLSADEMAWLSNEPFGFLISTEREMQLIATALQNWQLYFSKNSGAYEPVTTTSLGVKSADASTDADETKILIPRL